MATPLVGSRIKRREDPRMIMGRGTYVDDVQLPRMTYAAILRSPYAHARILSINVDKAKALPGVVAVLTGADLQGQNVPCGWTLPDMKVAPHPALAIGKVRYTGDAVAVVVAEERYLARDALDLIEVDYEPLPVVVDAEKAIQPGAPQLHDEVPNNTTFVWKVAGGDIDKAFREAEVVVKQRIVNQRLIPNAIEPRGMVAQYNPGSGDLTLWTATQIPHLVRLLLSMVTGIPEHKVRVIAPDIGGGFGSKLYLYPEEVIMATLAKTTGRPVKWIEERRENYVATTHGRDHVQYVEVAAKRDGTITGLRVQVHRQHGGLSVNLRAGDSHYPLWPDAHRQLSHSQYFLRSYRRAHQHDAGGCLPWRRTPRGHLPGGARRGLDGQGAGDGPGGDSPS